MYHVNIWYITFSATGFWETSCHVGIDIRLQPTAVRPHIIKFVYIVWLYNSHYLAHLSTYIHTRMYISGIRYCLRKCTRNFNPISYIDESISYHFNCMCLCLYNGLLKEWYLKCRENSFWRHRIKIIEQFRIRRMSFGCYCVCWWPGN